VGHLQAKKELWAKFQLYFIFSHKISNSLILLASALYSFFYLNFKSCLFVCLKIRSGRTSVGISVARTALVLLIKFKYKFQFKYYH